MTPRKSLQQPHWASSRAVKAGWMLALALLLAGCLSWLLAPTTDGAGSQQALLASREPGAGAEQMAKNPCPDASSPLPPGRAHSLRPGGTPMELPTRPSWQRMQADPTLPERNASLLAEFESAPWLLPPRTPALAYAGVHDLDALLRLRATPMGHHNKTVALLTFDQHFSVLSQNTIYSMVKLGGVRNYIVGTWSASDLQACAAMNLPCADLSPWLPEPMDNEPGAGGFGSQHDYLVIGWLRAVVVARLLRQGYVVYVTDSDVAFVNKPIWDSYLAFIEEAGADAAFQAEDTVNIGNYAVLPSPAAISFFRTWAASARAAIQAGQQDQFFLPSISHLFQLCNSRASCLEKRKERDPATQESSAGGQAGPATSGGRPAPQSSGGQSNQSGQGQGGQPRSPEEAQGIQLAASTLRGHLGYPDPSGAAGQPRALFRTFLPSFWLYSSDLCSLGRPDTMPLVDTCDWSVLFFHPVCVRSYYDKTALMKQQGVWLMDEESCTTSATWAACQPLRWRQPEVERHLYACPEHHLALVHQRPQRQA